MTEASIRRLPSHTRAEYTADATCRTDRYASLREDSRTYIRLSIVNAWQKLNDYYEKLDNSPLFAAAVILHPGRSFRWLEDRWDGEGQRVWLQDAKSGLEKFWATWYRDTGTSSNAKLGSRLGLLCQPSDLGSTKREESAYQQWLNSRTVRLADESTELDRYLRLELPMPIESPIQWWMERRLVFPTLSQMALDIFAIPAMAADCERAFSLAKLTLTSQRLSMAPPTLEKVQCLKNWIRRDAVTLGGLYFSSERDGVADRGV